MDRGPALSHEVVLPAPPERVWAALVDLERWSAWNPTLAHVSGEFRPGTVVRMRLRLGPARVPMRQEIRVVEPPQRLVWRSINGVRGFMDVDREFLLEPVPGGTRLVQRETAHGPGRALMPLLLGGIRRGYEQIAAGLAAHLGAGSGSATPDTDTTTRTDGAQQ